MAERDADRDTRQRVFDLYDERTIAFFKKHLA
jgi:hypothetical protein